MTDTGYIHTHLPWGKRATRPAKRAAKRAPDHGVGAIAETLQALEADGWRVAYDVSWPSVDPIVDHVVIGDGQGFLIAVRDWSGDITARRGVLRVNGTQCREVEQLAAAASRLAALLPDLPERAIKPVLAVDKPEWLMQRIGRVDVTSTPTLVETLRAEPMLGHQELDEAEVERILAVVAEQAGRRPAAARRHRA